MNRLDWINVAFAVIIAGGLLLIAATAQGAPRCPGGYVDGAGRCVYVNPAANPTRPSTYPPADQRAVCGTRIVAGVAVRHCNYPPMPGFRRPNQ